MRAFCEMCGKVVRWVFVGKREDEHGRVWEIYRCPNCGTKTRYAVG
jgi:RNase P subunit RPR2